MYKPQKVSYFVKIIEKILYQAEYWDTLSDKQKDDIYEEYF